ncbi:hypothetical protein C4552_00150 [Candidatus Parcubacteria bacterium]|nr:MAG: hypothetical protein C4552_00150 [Candidatus Parcubacteria bacterium]
MRVVLWLLGYIATLGIEIAVLPAEGILAVLPLAHLLLVTAIAFERTGRAFWIAACAGIIRDSIALGASGSHAIVFLAQVAIIAGVRALADWDEPLRTIMALAIGLAATPLAALVSFGITPIVSGESVVGPWYAFPVAPSASAFASAGAWVGALAFLMIRGFFRRTSDSFIR